MRTGTMSAFLFLFALSLLCFGQEAGKKDVEPDRDAKIKMAVDNQVAFGELMAGVEMADGVNIFVEVISLLQVKEIRDEVKDTRVALMTAFMFKKWASRAKDLAESIAQSVPPELLSPIVAAAAVVMGNQSSIITEAFVSRVPEGYAQTLRNSGAHPETVLPPGMLMSIGLPVPHTEPATGREPTSLPVVPHLVTVEGGDRVVPVPVPPSSTSGPKPVPPPEPPPPPPVPPPYSGQ